MKKRKSLFDQFEFGDVSISVHPAESFTWWRWKERLRSLLPDPSSGLKILDVGCGIGKDIFALPNGHKMFRVGLDQAFKLVYFASRLAQARGDKVCFCQGDGENLPFRSEAFDIVWCSDVIEHLDDPSRVFQEFWRILKPGGVALVSTPNLRCITSIIHSIMPAKIKTILYRNACKDMARGGAKHMISPKCFDATEHRGVRTLADWISLLKHPGFEIQTAEGVCIAGGARVFSNNRMLLILMIIADLLFDLIPPLKRFKTPLVFKAFKK